MDARLSLCGPRLGQANKLFKRLWVRNVIAFVLLTIPPFPRWISTAGIFASLAALMFNGVRREELQEYSPFDDGEGCRYLTTLPSTTNRYDMLMRGNVLSNADVHSHRKAQLLQRSFKYDRI